MMGPVAQLDPYLARPPLAKLSRISTSDDVSANPKMSAFSAIRSAFADRGMATIRCSKCQRRTTCAEGHAVTLGDLYEPRVA